MTLVVTLKDIPERNLQQRQPKVGTLRSFARGAWMDAFFFFGLGAVEAFHPYIHS
jgi:hypothetical protein